MNKKETFLLDNEINTVEKVLQEECEKEERSGRPSHCGDYLRGRRDALKWARSNLPMADKIVVTEKTNP